MPFKLSFTGLCAFVPQFVPGTPNNHMHVLLVDARGYRPGHGAHAHVHHEPVLVAQKNKIDSDPQYRQPDGVFQTLAGVDMGYFFLADRDLEIIDGTSPSLEFVLGKTECPTEQNKFSFEWVVQMEEATTGSGQLNPDCLATPAHDSVVARVLLKRGTVSVTNIAQIPTQVLQWEFKPAGSGNTGATRGRPLAERVQLEYPLTGTEVKLRTTYFRNLADSPAQVIRLTTAADSAEASVLNLPWRNIRGLPQGPHAIDYHFEHFYSMSKAPGAKNLPHPIANPRQICPPLQTPPSPETPLCPPTRFNPLA